MSAIYIMHVFWKVLKSLGLVAISESTYKQHAQEYLQPTIYKVWIDEQKNLFNMLKSLDGGLVLGSDGR